MSRHGWLRGRLAGRHEKQDRWGTNNRCSNGNRADSHFRAFIRNHAGQLVTIWSQGQSETPSCPDHHLLSVFILRLYPASSRIPDFFRRKKRARKQTTAYWSHSVVYIYYCSDMAICLYPCLAASSLLPCVGYQVNERHKIKLRSEFPYNRSKILLRTLR